MFEKIETVQDVLPHISFENGISVSDRGDYSVANYHFTNDGTFNNMVARECRGLKFDPDGKLIARPFQKFFNLGEKRPPEDEAWDEAHVVMDKLDGSMVHPCPVAGQVRLMTRGGISPQAEAAEKVASAGVWAICADLMAAGITPVFEFTSPDHRIVLEYGKPDLTLLAARDILTGAYLSHGELTKVAARHDVPVVKTFDAVTDLKRFVTDARALEGLEGYVVAFASGERVKLKADAYALRHKALSGLAHEKNVLAMVVTDAVDDVVPLLSEEAAGRLQAYADGVNRGLAALEQELETFVAAHATLDRKAFAQKVVAEVDRRFHSVAFRRLDGTPVRAGLLEIARRAAHSDARVETLRDVIGATWSPDGLMGGAD